MLKKIQTGFASLHQSLVFKNPETELAYREFHCQIEKNLLTFIHLIVMLIFFLLTIIGFAIGVNTIETVIRSILLASSLLSLLLRNRCFAVYKVALILQGTFLTYYTMRFIIHLLDKKNTDVQSSFLSGNAIGILEAIFILSFKTVRFRCLSLLSFMLIKSILLHEEIQNHPRAAFQFFITIFQVFFFYLYHDILDRRSFDIMYRSKEKLRKFQDLLSNDLPANVMIMTPNFSSILYSNQFFRQKFALSEKLEDTNKVLSQLFEKLVLERDEAALGSLEASREQPSLSTYLRRVSEEHLNIQEKEVTTLQASYKEDDNTEVHYKIKLRKIVWEDQVSYAVVMNDVSDKQLIANLKMADEQKDRLLATVSHELRTPINGILGLLEIAMSNLADKDRVTTLNHCKNCSKLLLYLVNSILDLSQFRTNSLKIVKERFNINEMIEEIKSLYTFQCEQRNVIFTVEKDSQVPKIIYTDKYRLVEILISILGNATKFTFEGSIKLKLSFDEETKQLVVNIQDTGIGIRDEDKSKLFNMFGNFSSKTDNINSSGAGLGLTIANELVRMLNGKHNQEKINFESKYGEGSRFFFRIDVTSASGNNCINKGCQSKTEFEDGEIYSTDMNEYYLCGDISSRKNEHRSKVYEFKSQSSIPKFALKTEDHLLLSSFSNSPQRAKNSTKEALLIDDNPFNLMAASFLLNKLGFKITQAFNGYEGLRLLEKSISKGNQFDLVLTDIQMPVLDGIEMTKRIQEKIKNNQLYDVPIIAVTAKVLTKKEREMYKGIGIAHSLEKPLLEDELRTILENIFDSNK